MLRILKKKVINDYIFVFRLLLLLPPSESYMERLASGAFFATAEPRLLHTLIWGPRTAHKNYSRWLRDCLIKQGTQNSEKLLKTVSDAVNNVKYDVTNTKNCIIALTPDIKKGIDFLFHINLIKDFFVVYP